MSNDVEKQIERLRKLFEAENDAELAKALRIGQSAISTWKARGAIPKRYLLILREEEQKTSAAPSLGPAYWGGHQNVAFGLALVRFARLHGSTDVDKDFRATYTTRPGDFWSLFHQAQNDLHEEMERSGSQLPQEALALILNDERADPEKAKAHAAQVVEEVRTNTFRGGDETNSP